MELPPFATETAGRLFPDLHGSERGGRADNSFTWNKLTNLTVSTTRATGFRLFTKLSDVIICGSIYELS